MALAQKLVEGAQVGFVQKKQGLRKNGLAGEPWQGLAGKSLPRPDVVLFTRVEQGDQRAAVNDAIAWHG
jgi:hypothetical protein